MKFNIFSPKGGISVSGVDNPDLFADTYTIGVEALFEGLTPNAWEAQTAPVLLGHDAVVEGDSGEIIEDPASVFAIGDRVQIMDDSEFDHNGEFGRVTSVEYGLVNVAIDGQGETTLPYLPEEIILVDSVDPTELVHGEDTNAPDVKIDEVTIFAKGEHVEVVRSNCTDSGMVYGLTGTIVEGPVVNEGTERYRVDLSKDPNWEASETYGQAWFWVDSAALAPFYPPVSRKN